MRPLRQINFVIGLALLIVGGVMLTFGLRNMAAGFRLGGLNGAYGAPNGIVDGAIGFAFIVIGLAMLRATLRGRLARLFVIVGAVMVVFLGIHAGYVG
jgi:hypothetical protein